MTLYDEIFYEIHLPANEKIYSKIPSMTFRLYVYTQNYG